MALLFDMRGGSESVNFFKHKNSLTRDYSKKIQNGTVAIANDCVEHKH